MRRAVINPTKSHLVAPQNRLWVRSGQGRGQRPRGLRMLTSILRHDYQQVLTIVLIIAVSFALPCMLSAQAYFGTVTGELTDASGAVVQGAKVILTDQQK